MKASLLVPLLCLLPLALSSCRKSKVLVTPYAPAVANTLLIRTFIDKTGSYTHSDGKGTTHLELSGGGTTILWSLEIHSPKPGGGSSRRSSRGSIRLDDPGDPWFVYAETPQRIWLFDGKKDLDYSLHGEDGSRGGTAIFEGRLQPADDKVPDQVIRKLPAELQKLFPPLPPAGPRPSI